MQWEKKGLIFNPKGKFSWAYNHALQPTPLILKDKIRIFVGLRDQLGVSRIGYVDLDKNNPTLVLGYSEQPILDIGQDGCFDESGVVPSAIVSYQNKIYLFYAGYQLGKKVRFSVLGGLAISEDNGQTFKRVKRTPVFERNNEETLFRVPHTVLYEDQIWKAWYGGGDHFVAGKTKTLPIYDIRYTESTDPCNFKAAGKVILETMDNEYRLGRPFLVKRQTQYYLFYGYSTENAPYQLGYAVSNNLKDWVRMDADINLALSKEGWDSEMMAYPCMLAINNKYYLLYNGNNYGEDGFGLAELIAW